MDSISRNAGRDDDDDNDSSPLPIDESAQAAPSVGHHSPTAPYESRRIFIGCCQGEPTTESGKRRQIIKMMSLLLVPVLALSAISSYFVAETVMINNNNERTRNIINFSIELGGVLYKLQMERDQSVLYLSNIGPATKTYLLKQYLDTNEYIGLLSMWPGELENNAKEYVRSRKAFQRHLTRHRNEVDLKNFTVFAEITFYNELITIFHKWLYRTLDESRYSTMWKTLVAYQKIIFARLYVGVERALGSYFFSKGGFAYHSTYQSYNEALNVFHQSFRTAQNFSSLVKPISSYDVAMISGRNLTTIIDGFRYQIRYLNITEPSLTTARFYFDNMTSFIDILLGIQTELAQDILQLVNDKESSTLGTLAVSVILVVIVVTMIPLLTQAIHRTTSDLQSYAIILAEKTKELDQEKEKTASLLQQMLPKQVARQLKQGVAVRAKYYKKVTVFFSDIVGFTSLTSKCTPIELVEMLNNLYKLFDDRIDLYDVYKVETVGDSYMVASGLPTRNGDRHASEVANMSLDLIYVTSSLKISHIPEGGLKLRIGVHTGPVVAGLVGTRLPRFCLFGDTITMALRMETAGLANTIHISEDTYQLLEKHGGYNMVKRGQCEETGNMVTYWLLGRDDAPMPRTMNGDRQVGFLPDLVEPATVPTMISMLDDPAESLHGITSHDRNISETTTPINEVKMAMFEEVSSPAPVEKLQNIGSPVSKGVKSPIKKFEQEGSEVPTITKTGASRPPTPCPSGHH